jgi:hypothetical protein
LLTQIEGKKKKKKKKAFESQSLKKSSVGVFGDILYGTMMLPKELEIENDSSNGSSFSMVDFSTTTSSSTKFWCSSATNKRSAFHNHVEILGFKSFSKIPISIPRLRGILSSRDLCEPPKHTGFSVTRFKSKYQSSFEKIKKKKRMKLYSIMNLPGFMRAQDV